MLYYKKAAAPAGEARQEKMKYGSGVNRKKYSEIIVENRRMSRYNEKCLNTTYPAGSSGRNGIIIRWKAMFNLFSKDIGIDLGTASVLVYIKGKGVVLREPSVVAMDKNTGKLLKVGTDAQAMLGRTPGNIVAMRPLTSPSRTDTWWWTSAAAPPTSR